MKVSKSVGNKISNGMVFAIPLDNQSFSFCVACVGNEFAFFDYQSNDASLPNGLIEKPIIFRILVAKGEHKVGGWHYVGQIDLPAHFKAASRFLHKPVGSENYFIYYDGVSMPAEDNDVQGLELLTIWFAEDVVERLKEYFKGESSSSVFAIKKQLNIEM
ncbi:hypothetical protein [Rheinheimera soli]|uniref:Immunity protein 26 n=1 Tax=Rheinheimera soli TaxID=443616 RepID=A0ABU1W551_9GAMM|nr:hypothetical protein [Rheinheimera soli]MDR7123089.1 hypothetical protein [Rheinheimera soli]